MGQIGPGLNLRVGIAKTDTPQTLEWMAQKCLSLRLFASEASDRCMQGIYFNFKLISLVTRALVSKRRFGIS